MSSASPGRSLTWRASPAPTRTRPRPRWPSGSASIHDSHPPPEDHHEHPRSRGESRPHARRRRRRHRHGRPRVPPGRRPSAPSRTGEGRATRVRPRRRAGLSRFQSWHARLAACDPAADLEAGERAGARLVIPGDAEWPTQLDALGSGRPLGLWLHGTADLRFSCLRSVAVVGARAATSYGVHVAAQFGIGLSEAGWTVVSGGAFGIDGAAHRGALAAGGPTVVVLACGVDYCYPAEHRSLFAGARDRGVLVSECPPGVRPTRSRFLIRNRVIAALSRGTLVVEAALRSGALNTAKPRPHARQASRRRPRPHHLRPVRRLPPSPARTQGRLRDDPGGDDRTRRRHGRRPRPRVAGPPALPRDSLPEQTKRVLDAVPARISAGPATIAVTAGVDLNTALSALGSLAATGYIERTLRRLARPPPGLTDLPEGRTRPSAVHPGGSRRRPRRRTESAQGSVLGEQLRRT
ncbi:DNA-processing protein DprA [Nonomuraea ferruginea]